MNKTDISGLLASNINKIRNERLFKSIITMNNNLIRFDYINRILIAIQSNEVFDIRTDEEWMQSGRDIIDRKKKIYVAYPVNKSVYVDAETGNEISETDLNVNELPFALRYGIVKKKENIDTIDVIPLYDIRNTYNKEATEYKIDKQSLSSSKVLSMAQEILGCNIEKSELTYYSSSQNTLYVDNKPYNELAESIVEIIVNYYMNRYNEINNEELEKSTEYTELLKEVLKYSIGTLLNINMDTNLIDIKTQSIDNLLSMISINQNIINCLYGYLGFDNTSLNKDAAQQLIINHKASVLLDLMEANEQYLKLKGKK